MDSQTSLHSPQNSKHSELKTSQNSNPSLAINTKFNRVIDEIARGKEYTRQLEQRQTFNQIKSEDVERKGKQQNLSLSVEALQKLKQNSHESVSTKPVELHKQLYPDVYVERIVIPEYTPNYEEIPRFTRNIVDRDTLSMKQHINLLAQPRIVYQRPVDAPYIVRRKVPGPSPRIVQLSRPKRRQTLATCKQYGATMNQQCIENCRRNIQDVTFVPVHDAVYFIELKRRRPLIEKQRLQLRMKRLQEKIIEAKMAKAQDVIRHLYSSLKSYLLPPPLPKQQSDDAECEECAKGTTLCTKCSDLNNANVQDSLDDETLKLSNVLRFKMETLCDYYDKIEQGSYMDKMFVYISNKLAVWMKKLVNSEAIEGDLDVVTTVVTTEVTEIATEVTEITTDVTQVTDGD